MIRGVAVHFPYPPYPAQIEYMSAVIDALNKGCHALLESPTGTGKTLCLLCATLAWVEQQREQGLVHRGHTSSMVGATTTAGPLAVVPNRVVYASRTHAQLNQVIRELRKTPYEVHTSLLASREHMCVHPKVSQMNTSSAAQNSACNALRADRGCRYFNNVQNAATSTARLQSLLQPRRDRAEEEADSWDPKQLLAGADTSRTPIVDLEDLGKLGRQNMFCPYFYQRFAAKEAQLVFLPYTYVFDGAFRRQLPFSLDGAIVIVDEAHNIPSSLHNNSSQNLTPLDLSTSISDMTRAIGLMRMQRDEASVRGAGEDEERAAALEERFAAVKIALVRLETVIAEEGVRGMESLQANPNSLESMLPAHRYISPPMEVVLPGSAIFSVLAKAFINKTVWGAPDEDALLDGPQSGRGNNNKSKSGSGGGALPSTLYELLVEAISALSVTDKGGEGVSRVQAFLTNVFLSPNELDSDTSCRTVFLGAPPPTSRGRPVAPVAGSNSPRWTLGYWCLDTTGSMLKALQGVRCCLLTSGTLSPMDHFAAELGVSFPVRLQGSHVIDPSTQLMATILTKGPGGQKLNGSYSNRSSEDYRNALGFTILNVARSVPNGVLVFFPSYTALHSATELWMAGNKSTRTSGTTLWGDLAELKDLFVEPTESSELPRMIQSFQVAADKPDKGAILFAVCRGKVSEGVDFSDQHGRCVVVTGIPFANTGDLFVRLKREYLTQVAPSRPKVRGKLFTGEDWYRNEAMRAVNQCLGRVIRHKNDYGAIVLADERFTNQRECLSHWIAQGLTVHQEFRETYAAINQFFAPRKYSAASRQKRDMSDMPTGQQESLFHTNSGGGQRSVPSNAMLAEQHQKEQERQQLQQGNEGPTQNAVKRGQDEGVSPSPLPTRPPVFAAATRSPFSSTTTTTMNAEVLAHPTQHEDTTNNKLSLQLSNNKPLTDAKDFLLVPPMFRSQRSSTGPPATTAVASSPAAVSSTTTTPSAPAGGQQRLSAKDYCAKLKTDLTTPQYDIFRTALSDLVKLKPKLATSSLEEVTLQFEHIIDKLRVSVFEAAYGGGSIIGISDSGKVRDAMSDFAQFVPEPLKPLYDHILRKRRRSGELS